ncbi:S8 family peptidase [Flavobacteriaceae bacterium M23B6Z8]
MKKIIVFFVVLLSFSSGIAQEILPESIRPFVEESSGEATEKGFYLIQLDKRTFSNTAENPKIIRRLENDFVIVQSSGIQLKEQYKNTNLYSLKGEWKYSNSLTKHITSKEKRINSIKISLQTTDTDLFLNKLPFLLPEIKIIDRYKNSVVLETDYQSLSVLHDLNSVHFIDLVHDPKTETPVNENDLSVNRINKLQFDYPEINGSGMAVSVKELLFDSTDIDFRNRYFFTGIEAEELDQHAAAMGTVIGGGGNTSSKGRGVANAVQLTSSSFLRLLPDDDAVFNTNNISVQNHSYGTVIENEYGNEAAAYDDQIKSVPTLLHIFSSGNSGTATPENGPYAGIEGFANQTGNFKMAKNIITVGAINDLGEIDARSSKGPAFDGRVKPELSSYAPGGTSDASALVAGTAILLQQFYREANGSLPNASLIKALLIAGAEDIGPPAIDYQSGYGSMNAIHSIRILEQQHYFEGSITEDGNTSFEINIPENTAHIRIAVSWTDEAANPGDEIALVNDLDIALLDANMNSTLPWILSTFPQIDSLTKVATRGEDHLNNTELITLENPASGSYTLRINGTTVTSSAQPFSVAYFLEAANEFEWTYPTAKDGIENEAINFVRWNHTLPESSGRLEININNSGWVLVDDSIDLDSEATQVDFTSIQGTVQLRMIAGANTYTSDIFGVSPEILPNVLFNCEEEVAFGWNQIANASGYEVRNLGDRYMETIQTVSDTLVVLPKSSIDNPYFSITPVFDNRQGIQGRTLDYELQGVNCYFINFFAFLAEENTVNATVNLSTGIGVRTVTFQRTLDENTDDISIQEGPFQDLNLTIEDASAQTGLNRYNALITLDDGSEIVTDSVEIFIPDNETLVFFPNPYTNNDQLTLISGGSGRDLQIVDLMGRILFEQEIDFIDERLNLNLLPGIYIVRLVQDGKTLSAKKLIVN